MVCEEFREERGIYIITQLSTGMKYVGKSINIRARISHHFGRKVQAIDAAIKKFGSEDFVVTARYFPGLSHTELIDLEYETIKTEGCLAPNGYNKLCRGSIQLVSAETKRKMSESAKGKKKSAQARLNMSKAQKGRSVKRVEHDFSNLKTDESFTGTIIELAQNFNLNLESARRAFYSRISHKGWTRR